jgi:CheY-like chemotaxis protein
MIDPTPDSRSSQPLVVLLVDDQAFVGAALRMMLAGQPDIELHSCLSALEAIAMANELAPAVVLQDLVMPDIDGLTLGRAFRDNPPTARTPVIVLSGNDDAATRTRALAAGAADYLVKLPPPAELIACIRRHAQLRSVPPESASAGQASPGAGEAETLDLSVIAVFRDAGAPDFALRLIDQFLQEAGGRVHALAEAAGRADGAALKAIGHSLKGSSLIMGASRLASLCAQVEDQAAGTSGGTVAPALVAEIEQELVRVQHALTAQKDAMSQA